MAKAKKVTVRGLQAELRSLKIDYQRMSDREEDLRSELWDRQADLSRMTDRAGDYQVKLARTDGEYAGYRRRVLELDGVAASEPVSAAAQDHG